MFSCSWTLVIRLVLINILFGIVVITNNNNRLRVVNLHLRFLRKEEGKDSLKMKIY